MGHILDDALVGQTRDKTDAVPCEHMVAIALSAVICPQITPMNVMLIWWRRTQWREQLPLDVYAEANIIIKSVKEGRIPELSFRLWPDWTGPNKSGCPKMGECHKLRLEKAMAKGKPGAKWVSTTKRRRCLVCGKFGHDSEGYWLLEKRENLEPVVVHTLPIAEEMDDEGKDKEGVGLVLTLG